MIILNNIEIKKYNLVLLNEKKINKIKINFNYKYYFF